MYFYLVKICAALFLDHFNTLIFVLLIITIIVCVHECGVSNATLCIVDQRTAYGSQLSLSTTGIHSGSIQVVWLFPASTFTHWTILPEPLLYFIYWCGNAKSREEKEKDYSGMSQ